MMASYLTRAGLAALCFAALTGQARAADQTPSTAAGWELVWADEFDGDKLDPGKWKPEKSCWGGGNNERQCYTASPRNISVSGGMLHLTAIEGKVSGPDRPPEIASMPNPTVTKPFSSGKVRTRGIAAWRYGKVEFRARVPKGQGTWPAVWMMPAKDAYGPWPLSGEIDILEAVNIGQTCKECTGKVGENRMISALHFGGIPPANELRDTRHAPADHTLPSDGFHVWTLEWGKGLMRFSFDGKPYWQVTKEQWRTLSPRAKGNPFAPFDQPFYIMANLAVGGKLSEERNDLGIDRQAFPAEFAIDWIRVYQCGQDRETGLACMGGAKGEVR